MKDPKKTDFVFVPQNPINTIDQISGAKKQFKIPDMQIQPENKYREAYLKILTSQNKPFNKSNVSNYEFKMTTYDKVK